MEHAVLDQSRTCGPLLHTPEDVLLPMVFIKQVINRLCVCGPSTISLTGPAQAEVYVCSSYTEGKNELNFCILKILNWGSTWEPWYENCEGTGRVAVMSTTSWIFSLMCKKIPFSDQVNQIWGTNEGKHKYVLYNVNVWRETRWVVLTSEFENTISNRHS